MNLAVGLAAGFPQGLHKILPIVVIVVNGTRDLAPRLFSSMAGRGRVPFQVNGLGWLTIYIVAPVLGGLLGGDIYRGFFKAADVE